jgi:hypothetical protein
MSDKEPLTRRDLDPQGCGIPNCGHDHSILFLHSRCHPNAGVRASYVKESGVLSMRCRSCKSLIADIAVAP